MKNAGNKYRERNKGVINTEKKQGDKYREENKDGVIVGKNIEVIHNTSDRYREKTR